MKTLRRRMALSLWTALIPLSWIACAHDERNRSTAEDWVERRSRESSASQPNGAGARSNRSSDDRSGPSIHAVESDGLQVNNEVVTVNDILEPIQKQLEEMAETLTAELYYRGALELVRQEIVENVSHLLIYRRASQTITDQIEPALKKAVEQMERERITREFRGLETEYEKHLQRTRKTREQVRQRLRRSIVVDSYLRERLIPMIPTPSKKELLKHYQESIAEFTTPASRELYLIDIPFAAFYDREILLRKRPPLPEEERIAEQKARDEIAAALAAIQSGEPFEDVARRHSHGPHKEEGGFWGPIRSPMAGRWQVPYERFMQMSEGEISGIIEASKAFFIIKVGKVLAEQVRSFEDAQPEIIQVLKNRRFQRVKSEFLQQELDESTIGSLDDFVLQVMSNVPKPRGSNNDMPTARAPR